MPIRDEPPEGLNLHNYPYRVQTLIFDLARQKQLAWLETPLYLPEGAVIELGWPNRDAVVLSTRLALPTGSRADWDEKSELPLATLIVDVDDPGEGTEDFIPRHPVDREL